MTTVALRKKPSYIFIISIIGIMAAFIGFGKTFFLPLSQGSFKAPPGVHVHGLFTFAWVILFCVQSFLIHKNNYRLHKQLGFAGIVVALGVFVSLFFVGQFTVQKQLADGFNESDYSDLPGLVSGAFLFLSLVVAGLLYRKKGSYHKRFLLLATIQILWPAWFRFRHYFPNVPHPEYWFGLVLPYSLIVFAWIWEYLKYGIIHRVLKWVGLFIIIEQTAEQLMYDSAMWRIVAKWLYENIFQFF